MTSFEYGISTKPWHIVSSPTLNEVLVVLSGSEEVDAGLSCLTYNEQGLLTEKWRTTDPSFDILMVLQFHQMEQGHMFQVEVMVLYMCLIL